MESSEREPNVKSALDQLSSINQSEISSNKFLAGATVQELLAFLEKSVQLERLNGNAVASHDICRDVSGEISGETWSQRKIYRIFPLEEIPLGGASLSESLQDAQLKSAHLQGSVSFYFDSGLKGHLSQLANRGGCALLIIGKSQVSFFQDGQNPRGLENFSEQETCSEKWKSIPIFVASDPYLAMALASRFFESLIEKARPAGLGDSSIHPLAVVDPTAKIGNGVLIGPGVVVGKFSKVGDGSILHSGVVLGNEVKVGVECELFPGTVLYDGTSLGNRCRIHAGVVLGGDGFGYALKRVQGRPVGHEKIVHSGKVIIGNDVEIGANSTVDRGTFSDTVIEDQVKIDNQVQIGHNCKIGFGSIICGKVGLSGSVTIGKFVVLAGDVGVGNKVCIGDGAQVGGGSKVGKDIPPGEAFMGYPARSVKDFYRLSALLQKMVKSEARDRKKRTELRGQNE